MTTKHERHILTTTLFIMFCATVSCYAKIEVCHIEHVCSYTVFVILSQPLCKTVRIKTIV